VDHVLPPAPAVTAFALIWGGFGATV